jgi:hypothetical protein
MAKIIAVTKASTSLAEVEQRFKLSRGEDLDFFTEWQTDLPVLTSEERSALSVLYRRLNYHRADGELLEGAVTLLVASPLLELAGFYDPPYKLKSEATVEISVDDGEETLKGRLDALILQNQLWVLVLEAKKTTIPLRSALPQLLTYLVANPQPEQPLFGLLTNGDEVVFVKLQQDDTQQYDLSRAFSLYTVSSELMSAFQVLKNIAQLLVR